MICDGEIVGIVRNWFILEAFFLLALCLLSVFSYLHMLRMMNEIGSGEMTFV